MIICTEKDREFEQYRDKVKNKKVILRKVATFKEEKWDNTSYLNNYKVGIHSTLMRAKKFYSLMDLD